MSQQRSDWAPCEMQQASVSRLNINANHTTVKRRLSKMNMEVCKTEIWTNYKTSGGMSHYQMRPKWSCVPTFSTAVEGLWLGLLWSQLRDRAWHQKTLISAAEDWNKRALRGPLSSPDLSLICCVQQSQSKSRGFQEELLVQVLQVLLPDLHGSTTADWSSSAVSCPDYSCTSWWSRRVSLMDCC